MHISLWWEAFYTASFLINRMSTFVLNNHSPYQKLHHKLLNYDFLRIFGCACYPLLRPYNQYKLDFHSKKCLFIGYSLYCYSFTFNKSYFNYSELFPSSSSSSESVLVCSPEICILHDTSSTKPFAAASLALLVLSLRRPQSSP